MSFLNFTTIGLCVIALATGAIDIIFFGELSTEYGFMSALAILLSLLSDTNKPKFL